MRLWTIQPEPLYDQLRQEGVIYAEFARSPYADWDDFHQAYDWLVAQMRMRVGAPPAGVTYLIWAWHTLNWQHKKPDLRAAEFRNYSDPSVCLELELPDSQVLLSDQENWHAVLNQWYVGDAKNEAVMTAEDAWLDARSVEEALALKQRSWTRIFCVTPFDDAWQRRGCYVQATFWALRLADVRTVRRFHWSPLRH
ncbi:DUF3841 domain-containing protein [Lacticaseibacillus daqingensis]|uniref:DUF3841 domain-containing protein n=1 Tax=Lacticaseibacillus daqingensis TaxID=2486014 RepID=UPI000F7816D1|nr:DUF3841 domain-containing protein [Lacticaseibacillus daqingensis]